MPRGGCWIALMFFHILLTHWHTCCDIDLINPYENPCCCQEVVAGRVEMPSCSMTLCETILQTIVHNRYLVWADCHPCTLTWIILMKTIIFYYIVLSFCQHWCHYILVVDWNIPCENPCCCQEVVALIMSKLLVVLKMCGHHVPMPAFLHTIGPWTCKHQYTRPNQMNQALCLVSLVAKQTEQMDLLVRVTMMPCSQYTTCWQPMVDGRWSCNVDSTSCCQFVITMHLYL